MFIYDIFKKKINEGGFDIPEIPRAPTPKPPKEKGVDEQAPPLNVPQGWEAKTQADGSTRISKIGSMSSADYKQNMADYKAKNWTPEKMADYGQRMASGQGYTDAERAANYQQQQKSFGQYADQPLKDLDEGLSEDSQEQNYFYDFAELYSHPDEARHPDPEQAVELVAGQFNDPEQVARAIIDFAKANPQELQDSAVRLAVRQLIKNRQVVAEGSVQDELYKRHQEERQKSGLPNPDYYKELKASYDIKNDSERLARQAEIKKKYRVSEATKQRSAYKGSAGAQAIAQASGVKNINRIVPGQQLNIPGQATPYVVQKGDTLDAIARRFSAPAAAMEPTFTGMAGRPDPTFTGMAGSEFTGISQAPAYTGRGMYGSEFTGISQADTLPSFTGMAGSEKDAKIAARIDTDTDTDTDGSETTRGGFNFATKEPTNEQGIAEAIPYALSAANAAAEYRRQGAAGGGYRGRIDIPVQSREDYLAVGQMLLKAARAAGQKIEYGLSDGVMSIFSDSMTADELDEFIDRVLDQGLAEGSETHKYKVVVKGDKRSYSVWVEAKNEEVAIIRAQQYVAREHNDTAKRAAVVDMKQGVAEAGPFSYGAKKPRKGSVADLAAKKRREQERGKQPIEPKDQMVGTAKVVTNEEIESYLDEMRRAGYDIVTEQATLCPECGGPAFEDQMLAEKQDACYHKVKSRYKVWPSAYASGALVRCRKKGAKNWGNKSKK